MRRIHKQNWVRVAKEGGLPDVTAYRMPELVGLSVAEATYEWTHRSAVRTRATANPYNVQHGSGEAIVDTWEGFTGPVSVNIANPTDSDVVASYVTTPADSPYYDKPAAEGVPMPSTTSVRLTVELAPGTYYLAAPNGSPMVTGTGDRLYVEIA